MNLTKPRHCHWSIEDMRERPGETWTPNGKPTRIEKHCPNWVNQRKPRRMYWRKDRAEKMCWAYVCDWCWGEMMEATQDDWEGWPQGDDGKFIGSMECGLP